MYIFCVYLYLISQAEYHVMLGTFADYADASIQYGYATMFISAYPLAAILSFVNNYIRKYTSHAHFVLIFFEIKMLLPTKYFIFL